ncbi:TPR repeat-containing protein YrrB [Acaryochloris thomasi RCC1774]|uniref:protein O-GlcNAc transferase n=1 Tax=Acaryochloris thomasi RCC1774 TaxID=1764569 RepID=A0A2W1JIW8_9CYAN|nr:glycosyltransferase family 41 protein [Acaryochloris thomasi]PZD73409.1 TPR repeat-containing protein YrrB [Acaryochloris thomasi RCC1774]
MSAPLDSEQSHDPQANVQQLFNQAVHWHRQRNFSQALEVYQQVLSLEPNHVDVRVNMGSLLKQMGRLEDAIATQKKALTLQPNRSDIWFNLGNTLQAQGNAAEAESAFRQSIQLQPNLAAAHFNLGRLLQQQEQLEVAAICYRAAISHNPQLTRAHTNLGNTLKALGRFDEAVRCHQQAIALSPNDPEAHYNLGNALSAQGNDAAAILAYQESLRSRPEWLEAHLRLVALLQEQKNFTAAEQQLKQARIHHPQNADVVTRLALVLKAQRRFEDAIALLKRLLSQNPANAAAHCNLGSVYSDQGRFEDAIAHLRQALQLDPDLTQAHINLGFTLGVVGQVSGAITHCQKAIALEPDSASAYINLGFALTAQGRIPEAIASFQTLLKLEPDYHPAQSNFLYALNYDSSYSRDFIAEAHRRWGAQEQAKVTTLPSYSIDQPLRIGYLSPDFRQHSVAYFIEPILKHHDREAFQVYCYANVAVPDADTERIKALGHLWRDVYALTDEQLADLIQEDHIDILIDLAGHTGNNRLPVFARQPAPIQITYLGYPNTTGLTTMNYRITDALADPPGLTECDYTETLIRLPQCFLCYQPPPNAPPVNNLPALTTGNLTLGSCNNLAKLSPQVIECWAKILQALPEAQLLMKMRCLDDPPTQERFWRLFAQHDISRERVQLYGPLQDSAEHLAFYHRLDLALDPFPYNGTTTTCESLWMGVPVITLAGQTHVSRVGLSLLSTVGLAKWVTYSPEAYVERVIAATLDLEKLATLRSTLRSTMAVSALCNAEDQTRALEHLFSKISCSL